jgi:RHS repeat-associated protein
MGTDSGRQPVWQWPYSAFGSNTPVAVLHMASSAVGSPSIKSAPATVATNIGMPGQYRDAESRLSQNWRRYYSSKLGRYIQRDPIGLQGGLNTFGYVSGNPLTYADPQGLSGVAIGGLAFGLGALAIIEMSRPRDMNAAQESLFDRYCRTTDDPCAALKARLREEIEAARGKMNQMLDDPQGLYQNARTIPNRSITGGNTTWQGHTDDLAGRLGKIQALISLAHRMGCDVTAEMIEANSLIVPRRPGR